MFGYGAFLWHLRLGPGGWYYLSVSFPDFKALNSLTIELELSLLVS